MCQSMICVKSTINAFILISIFYFTVFCCFMFRSHQNKHATHIEQQWAFLTQWMATARNQIFVWETSRKTKGISIRYVFKVISCGTFLESDIRFFSFLQSLSDISWIVFWYSGNQQFTFTEYFWIIIKLLININS